MLRVCNEIATASLEFEQKQFSNCNARAVCGVNSRRNRVLSVAGCCWGTAESRSLPADRLGQFSFLLSIWSPAAQRWSHGARLSSAHISQFLAWDLKLSTQPLRASPEAIGHSFQFFIWIWQRCWNDIRISYRQISCKVLLAKLKKLFKIDVSILVLVHFTWREHNTMSLVNRQANIFILKVEMTHWSFLSGLRLKLEVPMISSQCSAPPLWFDLLGDLP